MDVKWDEDCHYQVSLNGRPVEVITVNPSKDSLCSEDGWAAVHSKEYLVGAIALKKVTESISLLPVERNFVLDQDAIDRLNVTTDEALDFLDSVFSSFSEV